MSDDPVPPTTVFFYGLFDPQTNELRYIGQTIDPSERYGNHDSVRLRPWLDELADAGCAPEMRILTTIEVDTATELTRGGVAKGRAELAERILIQSLKAAGQDLLNTSGITIAYQHTAHRRVGPRGVHPSPVAGQRAKRTGPNGNRASRGYEDGRCGADRCRQPMNQTFRIATTDPGASYPFWFYCSEACRAADEAHGLHLET